MMKKIITISFLFVGLVVYSQKSFDLMREGTSVLITCEDAISKFDEAISINDFSIPTERDEVDYLARTYFERGRCKKSLGKYFEAMKDFTKAIDISLKSKASRQKDIVRDYYMERGHLKLQLKDYNGAILDYKKDYYFRNDNSYYLGKAYYGLKNYKEARVRFQKAISLYTSPNLMGSSNEHAPSYYYYYLGICELNLNLMTDACNNLRIAGDLGDEDAMELIVKYCN